MLVFLSPGRKQPPQIAKFETNQQHNSDIGLHLLDNPKYAQTKNCLKIINT